MKETARIQRQKKTYTKERMKELVELYSDSGRRIGLTDEQLAMSPTVEEALDAIFGEEVA